MDGLQVAAQLKVDLPGTRIVMWSADPQAAALSRRAGIDAFVDKAQPLSVMLDALVSCALTPTSDSPAAERRTHRRTARAQRGEPATHLVLRLPEHRIAAGNTVSFLDLSGVQCRVLLPAGVAPGRPIPLPTAEGGPRHLVLTLD